MAPILHTEIHVYVLLNHSYYTRTWYAHSTLKIYSTLAFESCWSTAVANTCGKLQNF
jgi:hypothetical protein